MPLTAIALNCSLKGGSDESSSTDKMIGLVAEGASDRAVPDGIEMEELRWLSREEAQAMLDGSHPDVLPPSALGISRHLIHAWAHRD